MIYLHCLNNIHQAWLIGKILPKKSDTFLSSSPRNKKTIINKKNIVNELNKLVVQKDKIINEALFKKYFGSKGLNDVEMEL